MTAEKALSTYSNYINLIGKTINYVGAGSALRVVNVLVQVAGPFLENYDFHDDFLAGRTTAEDFEVYLVHEYSDGTKSVMNTTDFRKLYISMGRI